MFDVAVIGSGYGGAVMAARLAPHGRVVLVERGKRWRPGSFPTSPLGLARAYLTPKNPLGLWEMRLGAGVGNALVSAYGGASMMNYGITSQPEDRIFEAWPVKANEMAPFFQKALDVLQPEGHPRAAELGDQQFLDRVEPGRRIDLRNTIDWEGCTDCGDCPLGCNEGAKRSLDFTYLSMAEAAGVETILGQQVVDLRPSANGAGWALVLRRSDGEALERLEATKVVIAGGTFGTLDLLHDLEDTLPTTRSFGQRLTMNGDGLAFLYNTRHRLSGHDGAPITTSVRLPFEDDEGKTRSLTVMSGRIPRSVMRVAGAVLALGAELIPSDRPTSRARRESGVLDRCWRRAKDLMAVRDGGALSQTYMYKLDGEDQARGTIRFDARGRSAIHWPDYADDPLMRFASARLREWASRVEGRIVRDLGSWPGMRHFGVHALGGCRMGASPDEGVVDSRLRLYRPDGGLYEGLRVVDSSVIPTALGVPSSLTVAALAERAAKDLLQELH
ncbi:MAG: GMC family oxidoreductase [Deltaproteobacteria bacterium]|nr:GMC family oxidoreductase [Deltaproteobacteria bacterium]